MSEVLSAAKKEKQTHAPVTVKLAQVLSCLGETCQAALHHLSPQR